MSSLLLSMVVAWAAAGGVASADVDSAEAEWRLGGREEAGRLIREYVAANPDGARSARVAALLARTAQDPAEASTLWDEVLALEPRGALGAEAHWQKGLHAYSAGLYVAAAREFEALGNDFGTWFEPSRAFLWKGYAELGADQPEAALEAFRQAAGGADGEDEASVALGLANANFRLGNVRESLRRYQRFERDFPQDGRASAAARRAVECLKLLGREDDAARAAQRIGEDYPDSFEATLARAATRSLKDREVPWKEGEAVLPEETRGPFVVQVAAMTDPRNAATLRRRILALGIREIQVEPGDGPDGPVHRVLLGPYDDEEQARSAADSVATLGELNPRVREVRSN